MKRRQHRNMIAMLVFIGLVIAGGVALFATDNWENPFSAFTMLTGSGGERGEGGDEFGSPDRFDREAPAVEIVVPEDSTTAAEVSDLADSDAETVVSTSQTSSERPAMGEGMGQGRGRESSGFAWSQFGSVLYNVWFLFAAAAVMMLISLPLDAFRRRNRHRLATV